jgi:four helix bundle protein
MSYLPMEETRVYEMICILSDDVYDLVTRWPVLAQDTVGKQLIRALDSVGANLVEGDSRRSDADSSRYFRYARSSAREARYWLGRARARKLVRADEGDALSARVTDCGKMISGLLDYRHRADLGKQVREEIAEYSADGLNDEALSERPNDLKTE